MMDNQEQPNNSKGSNEIELGQLFELIKRGLHKLFKKFLRVFIYFKKNIIKLAALVIIGVAIGFLINNYVPKSLQTEVIVQPNFDSEDYLYATIDEVSANIKSKDTLFFNKLGIDVADLESFRLEIEPLGEVESDKEVIEQNNKFLEILQNYKGDEFILDVIKSEISQKSAPVHQITFSYKNAKQGEVNSRKIMDYINSNPYFKEVQQVYITNAKQRIAKNEGLIAQIDDLVGSYSKNLSKKDSDNMQQNSMILLGGENSLNVPNLLGLKSALVKEIGVKKIQIIEQANAVSIQSFGKTHAVQKSLFSKNLVLFPAILLGAFFVLSFILYLNKKAKELL